MSDKPRILTLDIETAPLESYTWGIWEENIGIDQIKVEWSILSYSAKWFGEKKLIFDHTGGRGKNKVRNDFKLMTGLWKLLDEADLVIAQNGKRFDLPKINARLLEHGFGPYSPLRVIDTLQEAKKHFGFTSNKLAWMSLHLTEAKKSEHKKFPGFELWKECLKDNPAAWREMRHYNQLDVIATEQLYLKMRPWIAQHPNVSAYSSGEVRECPSCGSEELRSNGYRVLQSGRYRRYFCLSCGGWSRGKEQALTKDKRKVMLVK